MIATPVSRDALLRVVRLLPTAPQILAQLGRLLLDMNAGLSDVTELLRRDAGLTARIIRVANSSVYGQGLPSSSLIEALARVGFKEVYRLTGFAAVAQISDQKLPLYGLSGAHLRENSLLTALVMETLAPAAGIDPRIAYTAGLLRSTGKIALDRILRDEAAGAGPMTEVTQLAEWEGRVAGLSNCEAAAIILKEWHFHEDLIAAIRDHYQPDEPAIRLAHLLNLAAGEAERSGYGLPGESGYWELTPGKLAAAGVSDAERRSATAEARTAFEAIRTVIA
jgi:HD-like signal output (HDOD) protein